MPHQHTEKVETVAAAEFSNWDLVGAYNANRDVYATFTEGDQGRLKALDWALAELKALPQAENGSETVQGSSGATGAIPKAYCIDIGCAHGQPVVQTLAEQGYETVGVDMSDGFLERAQRNLGHLTNASFELADMRSWQPPDDRRDSNVDCVLTFYAFGHLPLSDYEEMVGKMARWLKPGTGVLVLATVAQMHGWVTTRRATFPSTSLSIQENSALLERSGCQVVKAWEEEWISKNLSNGDSRTHQFICVRKK